MSVANKRPRPIQVFKCDEFEELRCFKRPKTRLTPTTATTPSRSVFNSLSPIFSHINTPSCLSFHLNKLSSVSEEPSALPEEEEPEDEEEEEEEEEEATPRQEQYLVDPVDFNNNGMTQTPPRQTSVLFPETVCPSRISLDLSFEPSPFGRLKFHPQPPMSSPTTVIDESLWADYETCDEDRSPIQDCVDQLHHEPVVEPQTHDHNSFWHDKPPQKRLQDPIEFHSQNDDEEKDPDTPPQQQENTVVEEDDNYTQELSTDEPNGAQNNTPPPSTEPSEPKTPDRPTVQLAGPPPPRTARKVPAKQPQPSPGPQPKKSPPPVRLTSKEAISLDNFITPPKKRKRITTSYSEEDEEQKEDEEEDEEAEEVIPEVKTPPVNASDAIANGFPPGTLVTELKRNPIIWKQVTKAKKGVYKCSHCKQKFSKLLHFAQHMDEKGLRRPYRCHYSSCPWYVMGFSKRSEWVRHTKYQHEREQTYKCPMPDCEKEFTRKDSLKRHGILVHDGNTKPAKTKYRRN
ncbi:hypothetical protein TRICI_002120 [Trichomonascus ciferrii]|uniref:C2H2-type domain-containing protein n=1 Tax=Trichomonascus ciferrii TaxID=44093 RepID=A0A642V6P2_9ASCO|nr:hypothetical protein TRICI_002120 [Trichomonascus ciferrii]